MAPSRPSRLMAHDRAWRNLASRPVSPLNIMTKAWPGAKDALTPDASSASPEAGGNPEPNRERATLPAAMMVMIAVNFGAVLGLVGWPVLQAFGLVNKPAVEVAQQNQAELMSRLDATVASLSARVASTSDKQEAASQFMAEIDARFVALRRSMRELRDAQNAARQILASTGGGAERGGHEGTQRYRPGACVSRGVEPAASPGGGRDRRADRSDRAGDGPAQIAWRDARFDPGDSGTPSVSRLGSAFSGGGWAYL